MYIYISGNNNDSVFYFSTAQCLYDIVWNDFLNPSQTNRCMHIIYSQNTNENGENAFELKKTSWKPFVLPHFSQFPHAYLPQKLYTK